MNSEDIEKLARALFEEENTDPHIAWDGSSIARVLGQSSVSAIPEEIKERYRLRVRYV